jgi:biopolymer transport protein ExbD
MGGMSVGSGHAGKKSLDSDIPLVPFIDLLLCCVMFLLVTAVGERRRVEPNRHDLIIAADDGVLYEHVIGAMDVSVDQGFIEVSLSDAIPR